MPKVAQGTGMPAGAPPRGSRRGPLSAAVGVFGELFLTAGVVLLLFVAWQLWWTNLDAGRTQEAAVEHALEGFSAGPPAEPAEGPALEGDTFAVLYVPRFGEDFARPVAAGVGLDVLNTLGIGHYPETQMPGEKGNFAVAAHRQTYGEAFRDIHKLREGDLVYVQTAKGFYTYAYRSTQIVHPSSSEVLAPVPGRPGKEPSEAVLTMTSCDPPFTTKMRIIAVSVLESFTPAADGPPVAIADTVAQARK
ncbi:class E sortase [Zafaria cholistanensis]|uniref:Class E sortase n=1 Tax=Zafaria cholistanensis TaxID=1682741 RepID=A0A5A7NT85_9MICC|nr:class E sortase [Zafaria cholistanensis]GER22951.1 class E sortase [Zafaria cholistanensis]